MIPAPCHSSSPSKLLSPVHEKYPYTKDIHSYTTNAGKYDNVFLHTNTKS